MHRTRRVASDGRRAALDRAALEDRVDEREAGFRRRGRGRAVEEGVREAWILASHFRGTSRAAPPSTPTAATARAFRATVLVVVVVVIVIDPVIVVVIDGAVYFVAVLVLVHSAVVEVSSDECHASDAMMSHSQLPPSRELCRRSSINWEEASVAFREPTMEALRPLLEAKKGLDVW